MIALLLSATEEDPVTTKRFMTLRSKFTDAEMRYICQRMILELSDYTEGTERLTKEETDHLYKVFMEKGREAGL